MRPALLLTLSFLFLCPLGMARAEIRTSAEWKKIYSELKSALYSKFRRKRAKAIRRIGEANYIKAVQTLVTLIERDNPRLAILEVRVREILKEIQRLSKLARNQGNRLAPSDINKIKVMQAELREINKSALREGDMRELATECLTRTTDEESIKWLRSRWKKSSPNRAPLAILKAFGFMHFPGVTEELRNGTVHRDPQLRVQALWSLGLHGPLAAWKTMREALLDDFWQVRATSVEWLRFELRTCFPLGRPLAALVRREVARAIGLPTVGRFIEMMGTETGRLRGDIDALLLVLVGRSFSGDHELWKSWWAVHGPDVLAGKSVDPHDGKAAGALRTVSFYGIQSLSKNILFIVDVSGSMNWKSPVAKKAEGGKDNPEPPANPEGDKKISIAKRELKKAIGLLDDGAYFNIIYYNSKVMLFSPKMVKTTKASRKKVLRFIDGIRAEGGTNIYDALVKAFNLGGGEGKEKKNFSKSVDTIFFLSDGVPSVGKLTDIELILKDIRERNRLRKIIIHAIGLSTKTDKPEEESKLEEFVKKLAEQNGGKYVQR